MWYVNTVAARGRTTSDAVFGVGEDVQDTSEFFVVFVFLHFSVLIKECLSETVLSKLIHYITLLSHIVFSLVLQQRKIISHTICRRSLCIKKLTQNRKVRKEKYVNNDKCIYKGIPPENTF